jgi:hypothetical protein
VLDHPIYLLAENEMLKFVQDRVPETYQKFTSCSIPKEILYKTTLSKGWCTPITQKVPK